MDKSVRRHHRVVAVLLFGLAVEEMILYPNSHLASLAATLVLFGLFYWFLAGND